MNRYVPSGLIIALLVIMTALSAFNTKAEHQFVITPPDSIRYIDPSRKLFVIGNDTVHLRFRDEEQVVMHGRLTEKDYREVAEELGVEVAAVKAVVEIEAGRSHQGFWENGKPLINFDLNLFRNMASRRGKNINTYKSKYPVLFARPNIKRFGSQQAAVQARLNNAMAIDSVAAIQGTYWGMFQIGGFNWRQCGTSSPQEFYKLMSRSERDQLELFAEFITRTGLLPALKAKNWAAFARGYNGPSYAARGYHTRMAKAYAKHKG